MTREQLMEKRRFFEKAFRDLGPTDEVVGSVLRALHIKGRRSAQCDCPLANWIKSLDPDILEVLVQPMTILIRYAPLSTDLLMEPTLAMRTFIGEFDAGTACFRDLIDLSIPDPGLPSLFKLDLGSSGPIKIILPDGYELTEAEMSILSSKWEVTVPDGRVLKLVADPDPK